MFYPFMSPDLALLQHFQLYRSQHRLHFRQHFRQICIYGIQVAIRAERVTKKVPVTFLERQTT